MLSEGCVAVLTQVAHSNGLHAGDVLCKGLKREVYQLGLVWPAGGSDTHLTPRGKAVALKLGIDVAPFSFLTSEQLKANTIERWTEAWDIEHGTPWLELALNTQVEDG